jgi:hypothetical protein
MDYAKRLIMGLRCTTQTCLPAKQGFAKKAQRNLLLMYDLLQGKAPFGNSASQVQFPFSILSKNAFTLLQSVYS